MKNLITVTNVVQTFVINSHRHIDSPACGMGDKYWHNDGQTEDERFQRSLITVRINLLADGAVS